jgi:hypothetical protein
MKTEPDCANTFIVPTLGNICQNSLGNIPNGVGFNQYPYIDIWKNTIFLPYSGHLMKVIRYLVGHCLLRNMLFYETLKRISHGIRILNYFMGSSMNDLNYEIKIFHIYPGYRVLCPYLNILTI